MRGSGFLFALPAFLFILAFMLYPLCHSFLLGFTDYNFAYSKSIGVVGLRNFGSLFRDEHFMAALGNTALFGLAFFPSLVLLSFLCALLLEPAMRGANLCRTCVFLPVIVALSLTGVMFQWIMAEQGILNEALRRFGLEGLCRNWLGDEGTALMALVAVSLWKFVGFETVIFLAGLQAIPRELHEAGMVDGAGYLSRVFRIVIPNLKETFFIVGLWGIIQSVKVFEQPFVMTQGGPGTSTLTLYLFTWERAFRDLDMGYASAAAYLMAGIILILSAGNWLALRTKAR